MGRQRRGEAVAQRGFPPRGTAERISRLEATVVGSADSQATGSQKCCIPGFHVILNGMFIYAVLY
ncbi:hypothetical protein [Nostoc sp.]|uniref:hypothetical protein n=1 Tax=Nostoc sp. TaxID=1180 RepID=UPI002FF993B6